MKTLKLPANAARLPPTRAPGYGQLLDLRGYLRELLAHEVRASDASASARRLREARFPDLKTLEQIDWEASQAADHLNWHPAGSSSAPKTWWQPFVRSVRSRTVA